MPKRNNIIDKESVRDDFNILLQPICHTLLHFVGRPGLQEWRSGAPKRETITEWCGCVAQT
jgi:hypothetical protein